MKDVWASYFCNDRGSDHAELISFDRNFSLCQWPAYPPLMSRHQKQEIEAKRLVGRLTNHPITHTLTHKYEREVKVNETWFIIKQAKLNWHPS